MSRLRIFNQYRHNAQPATQAVKSIAVLTTISLTGTYLVTFVLSASDWQETWCSALQMGHALRDHIGWGLSVFIATLITLYVAIFNGGHLAKLPDLEKTLWLLGLTSEAIAALSVPPVLLVTISLLSEPSKAGALFVIIPAEMLLIILATQLGRFEVIPNREAVRIAQADLAWASRQQEKLSSFTRVSTRAANVTAAVLFVSPPVMGIIYVLLSPGAARDTLLANFPGRFILAVFLLYAVAALMASGTIALFHFVRLAVRYTWLSWLALAAILVPYVALAFSWVDLGQSELFRIREGLGLTILLVTLAWSAPTTRPGIRRFSLRWFAMQKAMKSLDETVKRSEKALEKLEPRSFAARLRSLVMRGSRAQRI